MTATSILKAWEEAPNGGMKNVFVMTPNTADQNNTLDVTLANYGISATGLLSVRGWVHTTDGSVIVAETLTTSVTAGVLTIIMTSANTNCLRIFEIKGRCDLGVFA